MHFQIQLCSVLLLATSSLAASIANNHVLHEKRSFVPPQWVKRSKLSSSTRMPIRIDLTQSNLEKGQDFLMDVYVLPFHITYLTIARDFLLMSTWQFGSGICKLWKTLDAAKDCRYFRTF